MSPARVAFGIRLVALVICCFPALGQGTKIRPESGIVETDRDQPRQREQWFMHGRLIPGESAAALRYRAHAQKMQLRAEQAARMNTAITAATTTAIGIWTPLGPAPLASDATGFGQQDYGWVSGRATAVAVDPADATGNTVYIGGAYGGVWKSTNAGPLSANPANVSWSPLIDNQATLAVGSIAVQPGNTDPTKSVILVGTGETNSSMDSYYGLGILRSADAGNTWALITQDSSGAHPFAGMGFSKIAFSTANPSLVVAAAGGASQGVIDGLENPVSANRGIYYSNNGGVSWSYASINDVGTVIQPNSATSVIYNAGAGKFFAAIRFHGFYSSSDGVNWTRLATQPGGLSTFACPTSPASQAARSIVGNLRSCPDATRCTCGTWMKTKMTRESGKLPMAGIPGRKWMTAASRTAEISPAGAGLLRAATTWSLRRFQTDSLRPIFTPEQSTFTSARSAVCLPCAAGRGRAHFLI